MWDDSSERRHFLTSKNLFLTHRTKFKDMSEQKLTHWKTLASQDYIGAYSLYNSDGKMQDRVVEILSVAAEQVTSSDGKKEICTVAKLKGEKPFILNATNKKMLTKIFNTPFVEQWVGRPFTIYGTVIKIAGDPTECLRIRPTLPTPPQLPDLNPKHEKWEGAKVALKAGNTTIEAIRKSYTVSADNEKILLA